MKLRFPYDPVKYVAGLLLAWIIGESISFMMEMFHFNSPFPMRRIVSNLILGFVCLVPMLVVCSLVRRYWVPFTVFLVFVLLSFAYANLVLLPRPSGVTAWQMIWYTKYTIYGPIINYYIPALFFRHYCIWVCYKPVRQSEGAHDE